MKDIRKIIVSLLLCLASVLPAHAVFNEKDLARTLQVLRYELCQTWSEMERNQKTYQSGYDDQHRELMELMKNCNELSLMLYSQKQNFTFDVTYVLQKATDQYHSFNERKVPFDEIIEYLDIEIDRYYKLLKSLYRLPPSLDGLPEDIEVEFLDSLSSSLKAKILSQDILTPKISDDSVMVETFPESQDSLAAASETLIPVSPENESEAPAAMEEDDHGWRRGESLQLDSLSIQDRDSCIFYAKELLNMFVQARQFIVKDSENYTQTNERLREFFDYAQERYVLVQRNIFIKGQDNFLQVLKNPVSYAKQAFKEASDKYGKGPANSGVNSDWRGPIVISFSFIVLIYLVIAILLGNLLVKVLVKRFSSLQKPEFEKKKTSVVLLAALVIFILILVVARAFVKDSNFIIMSSELLAEYLLLAALIIASMIFHSADCNVNNSLKLYAPVLLLGLVVIACRIIFIPNSLATLLLPLVYLAFGAWQRIALKKNVADVPKTDIVLAKVSLGVTAVTFVMSLISYVLLSLQVYIWWIFQLAAFHFVNGCGELIKMYRNAKVDDKIREFKAANKNMDLTKKGALVEVTWLYDFLDMVVKPLLFIASLPVCLNLATKVFGLTEISMKFLSYPFINTSAVRISLSNLLYITGIYFLCQYLAYVMRGFYRVYKFRSAMSRSGRDYIPENEVNLTLSNNVIGILVWGLFAIISLNILKIPTNSLSVITAGLAAGLGFALKDVLNNLFYGVQLMSGRLKVGDYIECDGIRGKVENINYQSTQIVATDGSVMELANSTLFSKNFKNLTRNYSYEFLSLPVGVAYGSDVDKVREVILKAIEPLQKKDKYGRPIVDKKKGITVALNGFGDSSVDIVVKQYVLVEQKFAYLAAANEAIYNALNANGIEIPFPQQDVYIKQTPSELPSD